jgi:hypothetical protein
MPVKIDSVFYELALHDEEFAAALRRSVQNLDHLDDGAKKVDRSIGSLEGSIKGVREELKRFATNIIEAAALREFVRNTVEAQAAQAQLAAALRSTQGAAGFTLPQLEKMSEEMSRLSIFSDDAVKGGLSRLLTYTGLQGPMFEQAARATLDFATALGIDVRSAAERVGNALQYPTEAINSLTKQGFRFTSEQKRLIAAFEDTGQLAKAQAIILGELDLAYKGSADAARGTLGGALVNLKNQFMETLEVSKENSSGLIEGLNSVANAMPGLRDKFNAFFGGISLLAVDASIRVQKFLNLFRRPENRVSDADLEALRNDEERKILGLDQPPPPPAGRPGGTTPRGLTDAQIAAQRAARSGFEAAIAQQTQGSADNFDVGVQKLVAAAQKAHIGAAEIQRMVNELRDAHAKAMAEEGQKLALTMQGQLAELTSTTVDDLRAQLAEFDRAIEEQRSKGVVIDPTVVNQLRAAKEQAIALAPEVEAIAQDLERINATAQGGANIGGPLRELGDLIERQTAIRDQIRSAEGGAVGDELRGSVALKTAQEQLNALIAKEAELRKQLRAIIMANGDAATRLAGHVADVSGQIANAANAAFGLASAFLGVDSNITKALGSIGQLAGGISSVSELATKAGGFGNLFSTGAGIASAIPGIGQAIGGAMALANSLFGKSPEELERLRLLKENNLQLAKLSSRVGDLARINVQGTQLGQFGGFLNDPRVKALLNNPAAPFASQDAINRQIGAILDSLGLSAADLKEFAKSFGITVGTGSGGKITIEDLRQLLDAFNNSELNQFADDFAGQMQKLDAEIKLFSLDKPIEQFEAFRNVLNGIKGGSGALGSLLQGVDLTTAAGIDAARKAVQDLFTKFQSLPADQLAGFLGGLSPQEFLDAIQRATDFINAQAGSGGIAGTGGFNVSRTITETTGNRLEALSSTGNIFAERTARATEAIALLMSGGPLPVIAPPPSSSAETAFGTTVTFESITITVNGVADPVRGRQVGEQVSDAMIVEIDRKLASRQKWNRRAQGVLR